jgi:hypothetical protein
MGKVTVNHYLEKRVKELEVQKFNPNFKASGTNNTEELFIYFDEPRVIHPVYLQITINRKTTKIRSFTKYKLTESEFNEYLETGAFVYENNNKKLKTELDRVYRILDYFINFRKINSSIYDLKTILEFYSRSIDTEFYHWAYLYNLRTAFDRNESLQPLRNFIYWNVNPKEVINYFKKMFNVDLEQYLHPSELELIDAFDCFISSLPKTNGLSEKSVLIDWYNGKASDDFRYYMLKSKIELATRDRFLDRVTEFAKDVENLFLTIVKDRKAIDVYDNM